MPTKKDMLQQMQEIGIKEQMQDLNSTSPIRTAQEETRILKELKEYSPDLKGQALLDAVKYIPLLSEGELFQAATYAAAYNFSFPTAAKLVMGGFDYPQAHEIYEMVNGSNISIKRAKKYVASGRNGAQVSQMIALTRTYGIEEGEAFRMIDSFGEIADKIMEAKWRPYASGEGIGFTTIKTREGWFVFPKIQEDEGLDLIGKVIDAKTEENLILTEIIPNSRIYFVGTDFAEDHESPREYLGSMAEGGRSSRYYSRRGNWRIRPTIASRLEKIR